MKITLYRRTVNKCGKDRIYFANDQAALLSVCGLQEKDGLLIPTSELDSERIDVMEFKSYTQAINFFKKAGTNIFFIPPGAIGAIPAVTFKIQKFYKAKRLLNPKISASCQ